MDRIEYLVANVTTDGIVAMITTEHWFEEKIFIDGEKKVSATDLKGRLFHFNVIFVLGRNGWMMNSCIDDGQRKLFYFYRIEKEPE